MITTVKTEKKPTPKAKPAKTPPKNGIKKPEKIIEVKRKMVTEVNETQSPSRKAVRKSSEVVSKITAKVKTRETKKPDPKKREPKNGIQKPAKMTRMRKDAVSPFSVSRKRVVSELKEKDLNHILMYGSKPVKKKIKGINPKKMGKEDQLQSDAHAHMCKAYPGIVVNADIAGIGIAACTEKARRNGRLKGYPDYVILKKNKRFGALFIEFKIHPNKPTPEQLEVGRRLLRSGYAWKAIYDLDTFKKTVKAYVQIK